NGLAGPADLLRLTLAYRAPLDWDALASCLAMDVIPGVDFVERGTYGRTIELDGRRGVIFVQDSVVAEDGALTLAAQERAPGSAHLDVDISLSLVPVLMPLLARLRHLFDLDAEPTVIDSHLASEGLGELVMRHPGTRIPGAFSGFEVAFRTLLGGWIESDPETKEVARRVVEEIGEPSESADPRLGRLLPMAEHVAGIGSRRLHALGVPQMHADAIVAIARGTADGSLRLHAGGDPMDSRRALLAIGGVSEQSATMIIMRALSWPDAFPISASESASASFVARAERWRPWRAYALLHLWMDRDVRRATDARRRAASGALSSHDPCVGDRGRHELASDDLAAMP
ncbi:MAG TPA: AlkA N-terminal domain-containing protein, partial [Gemmatimonadaceae bacterium]